jgi:hypothetical protein
VVPVNGTCVSPLLMHAAFQQTMSRVEFVRRFTPYTARETFADHSAVSVSKHVIKRVLKVKTVNL